MATHIPVLIANVHDWKEWSGNARPAGTVYMYPPPRQK